jgi:exodeoxyribonuclease VII large subunit
MQALDPQTTLARGYTITMDAEGRPLTSLTGIVAGMLLKTRFRDGEAESIATKR